MNILIVEDNEINRRVATKVAKSLGHQVSTAENGLEAVEKAANAEQFDAILMDVQMPLMDGMEATREILAASPANKRPHIIAITANAVIGDREACLAAGMVDYLTKPLRIEPLRAALAKVESDRSKEDPDPLLDREQFQAIVDRNDPECIEIYQDFCELVKQQLSELETAARSVDWPRVRAIAHQLKGSSSTFGFVRFSRIVDEIENAAEADSPNASNYEPEELIETFRLSMGQAGESMPDERIIWP